MNSATSRLWITLRVRLTHCYLVHCGRLQCERNISRSQRWAFTSSKHFHPTTWLQRRPHWSLSGTMLQSANSSLKKFIRPKRRQPLIAGLSLRQQKQAFEREIVNHVQRKRGTHALPEVPR